MLFNSESDFKLSYQLSELNEKFIKSEAERNILEAKFNHLQEVYRNEEGRKLALLRDKYNEFLENCKERNIRNERILKSLQKVENGANAVFAKTERLKQLRSHYDAYLSRAMPLWRHPDALEDTGVPTTWIREPRLMTPCAHPAMLLPGGGAVMLPVQNNVSPHIYPQFMPRQVENKVIDTKGLPSPSDKVIATLGKAGEIMMQELGMLNNTSLSYAQKSCSSLPNITQLPPAPLFYQPYQLPIYIPPAPTYFTNPNFNTPYDPSMQSFTHQVPHQPPPHHQPQEYNSRSRVTVDPNQYIQNLKQTLSEEENSSKRKTENLPDSSQYQKNGNSYDKRKVSKDNYEIECLKAEINNYDDDLNLSDDDVLDSTKAKPQSPYSPLSLRQKEASLIQNLEKLKFTPNTHSTAESSDYPRAKTKSYNNAMHTAKIVEVEHQKSIDELKAMLSVENDESIPDMYMPEESDILADEDVPDDFNEQNFPENQRYQNDISRNVILEEDEDEDDYPPITTRRDDWHNNRTQQFQRTVPENYSVSNVGRNEPKMEEHYSNNNAMEEIRNQNIASQKSVTSPDMRIQQKSISKPHEVSRPSSGGRRSPSPTQNYPSNGNRKTGSYSRNNENQSMPGNINQPQQIQYEEIKTPLPDDMVNSYQDYDNAVDSRSMEQLASLSHPAQANNGFLSHQEPQQYQNEYNDYSSTEQAEPHVMTNAYEDNYGQYDPPTDAHGYIDHSPQQLQNQHVIGPDEYSSNYSANNQIQSEGQQYYRDDKPNTYAPQEMENRGPNTEYSDHYAEQQYTEYSQPQVNDQQYVQDNREYYSPHEGSNQETYHPQSYIPEEKMDHIEPSQERSYEQYQEQPYNSEPYQEQPYNTEQYHEQPYNTEPYQEQQIEHLPYTASSPIEQVSNDYAPSTEVIPNEYQQENIEDTNPQTAVNPPLQEDPVIQNFQPQLTKIEETVDTQPLIPQQQSNLDIIQPLQLVEEKPKSSPQKTPQRSPLQRKQSSLSQQSPQRQKQGQKNTQPKSQQRQSPKKSERTQQNSPKKPLTPEPQPPPSVITQLIDSESESYQVEPSAQNPDDSDFDFSIGK